MRYKRRVVVSGAGAVSAFGLGVATFWESVKVGRSAASPVTSFDASILPTTFAAALNMSDGELDRHVANKKTTKTLNRAGKMAVIAMQEAVAHSGLDTRELDPYRIGTAIGAGGIGLWDLEYSNQLMSILGSSLVSADGSSLDFSHVWKTVLSEVNPLTPLKALANIPTSHIAIANNARGPSLTVTTACTSSAQAIGEAFRQIRAGYADVMIAGGSDAMINPYGMVAFSMLGIMSTNNEEWQTAARPFDKTRDGFMLGEGACILILEEAQHCHRRGGRPLAEILGYSSSSDAYRLTDEPPEAWGSIRAMQAALEDSAISPASVTYINAHGTGTRMNDQTETLAIKTVFEDRSRDIPVSSTKSMIGHLVAAAGAIEFLTCLLTIQHQLITPTINYRAYDERCDLDYVPRESRAAVVDVVLSNSFGFGGQNACLVLGEYHD